MDLGFLANAILLAVSVVLIFYGIWIIDKRTRMLQALSEQKLKDMQDKKFKAASDLIDLGKVPEELAKKIDDRLLATGLLLILLGLFAFGELLISVKV